MTYDEYWKTSQKDHDERIAWFRDARLGLFIHYGLFASYGMGEWAQSQECWTISEWEQMAKDFCPKPGCTDEWCKLAVEAGAKYAVLTTRHHEGFSLWDSKVNSFNSMNVCGRDLVREFTDSCRKYGLKIGLYSSLMDWRHPDSWRCYNDEASRRRFLDYIEALNVELLSNYGKIDILWYDMPWPQMTSDQWESVIRNSRLRALQPHILINNRSRMPEDFYTPEESLNFPPNDGKRVAEEGADWEACLTFNGFSWGYVDAAQAEPYSFRAQQLVNTVTKCVQGGGNLLINIGPAADGSVPEDAVKPLTDLGAWMRRNAEAVYGRKARKYEIDVHLNQVCRAAVSLDHKSVYCFDFIWPKNGKLCFGGFKNLPRKIYLLATGEELPFRAEGYRLEIGGLPQKCPDDLGIAVLKMEFDEEVNNTYLCYYPQMSNGVDKSDGKGNP